MTREQFELLNAYLLRLETRKERTIYLSYFKNMSDIKCVANAREVVEYDPRKHRTNDTTMLPGDKCTVVNWGFFHQGLYMKADVER